MWRIYRENETALEYLLYAKPVPESFEYSGLPSIKRWLVSTRSPNKRERKHGNEESTNLDHWPPWGLSYPVGIIFDFVISLKSRRILQCNPWFFIGNNVIPPSWTLILPESWDESKTDFGFSRWRPRSMYLGVSVKIIACSAGYFAVSYRFLLPNKKKALVPCSS